MSIKQQPLSATLEESYDKLTNAIGQIAAVSRAIRGTGTLPIAAAETLLDGIEDDVGRVEAKLKAAKAAISAAIDAMEAV